MKKEKSNLLICYVFPVKLYELVVDKIRIFARQIDISFIFVVLYIIVV